MVLGVNTTKLFYRINKLLVVKTAAKMLCVAVGMAVTCLGCEKAETQPVFEYRFQTLNQQGQAATVFAEGENVVFRLAVTNKSNEDWFIDHTIFYNDDFMKVHRLADANASGRMVGRPFKRVTCTLQTGINVEKGQTVTVQIPWLYDKSLFQIPSCFVDITDNAAFQKGKYKTGINSSFRIFKGNTTFTTDRVKYEIVFDVR